MRTYAIYEFDIVDFKMVTNGYQELPTTSHMVDDTQFYKFTNYYVQTTNFQSSNFDAIYYFHQDTSNFPVVAYVE